MHTKLLYLEDFNVVDCVSIVTDVSEMDDGRIAVQLDQTCFYPRGGGQDWDEGSIATRDNAARFAVNEVRLDENGAVHHIGSFAGNKFDVGAAVVGAVDTKRRAINTRLHSAGHVVDLAVERLNLPWFPGRGAHYPHMSFVEYTGEIDTQQVEMIRQRIEKMVSQIIEQGSRNEIRFMAISDMHLVCRHVPMTIPTNKPARVVLYNDTFGVPCGGTHVTNVHDIGPIAITKIKIKKGVIKVSYSVKGVN